MKLKDIYNLAIKVGIENDPRGKKKIDKILKSRNEEYSELSEKKKKDYDLENLTDPYADSGIHFGDLNKEIHTVLVGIDIDSAEVLLVKELERMGTKVDLIIAHHPIGKSLFKLSDVMDIQTEVLKNVGVPENIAEGVLKERMGEVSRAVSPANHYQTIDTAKLLNISIINVHTPADNCAWNYLSSEIEKKKPETLGEILDTINGIPEYNISSKMGVAPQIFAGDPKSHAGNIIVDFTGGTENSEKIVERMSNHGIGTIVTMHAKETHRKEAIKHYINVVIAGHIASDSLGLNIILDQLEKKGIKIIPCSGLIRHSRNI